MLLGKDVIDFHQYKAKGVVWMPPGNNASLRSLSPSGPERRTRGPVFNILINEIRCINIRTTLMRFSIVFRALYLDTAGILGPPSIKGRGFSIFS